MIGDDKWYTFRVTVTVQAQSDVDGHRMMYPALNKLRKLDPVNREPLVELLREDDAFGGHHRMDLTPVV